MEQKYVWLAVLLAICYQLYTNEKHRNFVGRLINGEFDIYSTTQQQTGDSLFTDSELKKYNNLENGLYLSIVGKIFDVTAGAKHYGPGATYHPFTGTISNIFIFNSQTIYFHRSNKMKLKFLTIFPKF